MRDFIIFPISSLLMKMFVTAVTLSKKMRYLPEIKAGRLYGITIATLMRLLLLLAGQARLLNGVRRTGEEEQGKIPDSCKPVTHLAAISQNAVT
ncbi:hypothetical protein EVAR_34679_1 [Eumeta japonica]|uniref:Uncharacterized protein n=1 Tax=Eumeta variegata TaxID=151549 RepID=A0A4C1VH26_EUMVA|nr:hypothetical protein EVAR_34679_1 [Eumeta japonica]